MNTRDFLPKELTEKPIFTDEVWEECRNSKDFMPILFEWYKYIAGMCSKLAAISKDSPAIRKIPALNYAILTGLLNRCARLMTSNLRLPATNLYGETVALIDRSVHESAVIVQWLCLNDSDDGFKRYLASDMKSNIILKNHILTSISERNGEILVIEKRMLDSIEDFIISTGLTEEQIKETKPLPDLWSMCREIGFSERYYIGIQRMGSHEVHGTWTSLRTHYLRRDKQGEYRLRDLDVPPHENQFMDIPMMILYALVKFIECVVEDDGFREPISSILDDSISGMRKLISEITREDFDLAPE
ncbi:DUF5677 domain-containing protein [Chloroflexota bacterium]